MTEARILAFVAAEVGAWAEPLSVVLVRMSARLLGESAARERYRQEWIDTVSSKPGLVAKMAVALSILVRVPYLRRVVRHPYHGAEVVPDIALPPTTVAGGTSVADPRVMLDVGSADYDRAGTTIGITIMHCQHVEVHQHLSPPRERGEPSE